MVKIEFQPLDRKNLGYEGKYYPADMKFAVRPVKVEEVRNWSNVDEENPASLATAVTDLIEACVQVTSSTEGKEYSYKDIYEHDKIAFLLLIHNISFADDRGHNLFVKGQCNGASLSCGKSFDKLVVQPANLTYPEIPEKFEKYFDPIDGIFKIKTKTFGEIKYKPSTIGIGAVMMPWTSSFSPDYATKHIFMFRLIQACVTDHRELTAEKLRMIQISEYNTWNKEKIAVMSTIVKELDTTLLSNLTYTCPDCGTSFRCKMAIEGGFRSIFTPSVSDDEFID